MTKYRKKPVAIKAWQFTKEIEQMRRALEYALIEARSTECERLVKAALSAAKRGGK